jgi:hypothetical protein
MALPGGVFVLGSEDRVLSAGVFLCVVLYLSLCFMLVASFTRPLKYILFWWGCWALATHVPILGVAFFFGSDDLAFFFGSDDLDWFHPFFRITSFLFSVSMVGFIASFFMKSKRALLYAALRAKREREREKEDTQ